MHSNQLHLAGNALSGALGAVSVLSSFLERVLARRFLHRVFVARLRDNGSPVGYYERLRGRLCRGVLLYVSLCGIESVELQAETANAAMAPCPLESLSSLHLTAELGGEDTRCASNPLVKTETAELTVCWLTLRQAAGRKTCSEASPVDPEVRAFVLGFVESSSGGKSVAVYLSQGASEPRLSDAKALVVRYKPEGDVPKVEEAVLRIERKGDPLQDLHYVISARSVRYRSERFKVSLYGGSTYFYSRSSFADQFGELLVVAETRLLEADFPRQAKEFALPQKPAWVLRGYTEAGLSSTSKVEEVPSPATDSSQQEKEKEVFKGTKSFDGTAAAGFGVSFPARSGGPDPARFTVLFPFARVGVASLSGDVVTATNLPFRHMVGVRIEAESGHFGGAYFETGFGKTDQFLFNKTGRWKVDAFVPFSQPGNFRVAVRVQMDRSNPFRRPSSDPIKDEKGVLIPVETARKFLDAGEIKISLLVQIDIRKLFNFLGSGSQ